MKTTGALLIPCCMLLLSSCKLVGSSESAPIPLDFEKVEVQYTQYGTWIDSSRLLIRSSGTASAALIGNGSGEIEDSGGTTLTAVERERLATLLAYFEQYSRSYFVDPNVKDAIFQEIVLKYSGTTDTVGVSAGARVPASLIETLRQLDGIYRRAIGDS